MLRRDVDLLVEQRIGLDNREVARPLPHEADGRVSQRLEARHVVIHIERGPGESTRGVTGFGPRVFIVGKLRDDAGGGGRVEMRHDAATRDRIHAQNFRHAAGPLEAHDGEPAQRRFDRDVGQGVQA